MTRVTVEEAGGQLDRLLRAARQGEEVVLTQDDQPVARLVPIAAGSAKLNGKPQFGSAKHLLDYIADDFDAPLDDFKEYME